MWQVTSGSRFCEVTAGGACVTEGRGYHGNRERCTIRALVDLYATATEFQTESCCDRVTISRSQIHRRAASHFQQADVGADPAKACKKRGSEGAQCET